MNNYLLNYISTKHFIPPAKLSLLIFTGGAIFLAFNASEIFAQKATWRYVTTVGDGTKTYLNDEVKSLVGKNRTAWEKAVKSDGSVAVALAEWNCVDKQRLTRQITFYNSDNLVIGTKKRGFEWKPIIPGSTAYFLYRRVFQPTSALKIARISIERADLRVLPDRNAPLVRTEKKGERFQIVPESGEGGWFNLVDAATQEDYWLTIDDFEIVDEKPFLPKNKKGSSKQTNRVKSNKREGSN